MLEAEVYCDGASSGNPGRSGIGVVIRYKPSHSLQFTAHKKSEYIGIATNNIAEYRALISGLKEAKTLGIKNIKIFLDSELLVRQLNGLYRVKDLKLKPLWDEAMNLLKDFSFSITHIPRELNKEADLLSKQAVKNHKEYP